VHSDIFSFAGLYEEFVIVDESVLMRLIATQLSVLPLPPAGGTGPAGSIL